jgi:hypothetical protein
MFINKLSSKCPCGEMVDTLALGASVERRGGSSPSMGTNFFNFTLYILCKT